MEFSSNMLAHIITGTLAIVAGVLALLVKKGGKFHRRAGNIFFISMLVMSVTGGVIAWLTPMIVAVIAAVFTCYLVATSWMAIKTPERSLSYFDYLAVIFPLLVLISGLVYGMEAMNEPSGLKDGFRSDAYFFFAFLGLMTLLLDVRMLLSGGLGGAQRIARHLWRMCFALNIAVGSLLTQGSAVLPKSIQGSPLMALGEDIVLFLMIFWLFRILLWPKVRASWKSLKS